MDSAFWICWKIAAICVIFPLISEQHSLPSDSFMDKQKDFVEPQEDKYNLRSINSIMKKKYLDDIASNLIGKRNIRFLDDPLTDAERFRAYWNFLNTFKPKYPIVFKP